MHKLFVKVFTMVWLAIAGSILLLFLIIYPFRLSPFAEEVQERQIAFALDTTTRLLAKNGPDVAQQFIASAHQASSPVKLALSAIGAPIECAQKVGNEIERRVVNGTVCYQITAELPNTSFVSRHFPKLAPWLSALLAAALAAFWLARYLTRPVEQLRIGLEALASGRFDARIGDKVDRKRDEIAALAHDFDVTASRLQELQEVQQRLFHDVSHELRSPLSRLQAAIGVLRQNPARLEVMLERLEREIARMDDLVGEILTLARLTATGAQPLERQTLDLIDLVREIVDDSLFEGSDRRIRVTYEGVPSFVTSINGELIYRAVENVVRNAVKYSPPDSQVRVWCEKSAAQFVISVKDEGPGIPKGALDTMFQPFKRGDNLNAAAPGFGLGLSITKHAFELHGGEIQAELSETRGLLMRMILPL
ncbi:HAMP domain-containing sensor histidine kinase [Rhizobium rhizogenes]|uniref:HAMP domain-containing sensor histidine kinase n=1 Tax=Rhizobium rhizogenes TaxID=359 RepID=UPI001574CC29|nr:HAMP domain-containing sensor histidine kinase [Rhizobium rhizogenes]NTF89506.1 HAMP domain-containing histidine kinase [Rhizobium rhizogenes]